MPDRKYRLLIFDWDGTLIDSAAKIVACLHAAIMAADLPSREDAQLRHIIGLGIMEAFDYLYPEGMSVSARETVIAEYKKQFVHINRTEAPLFAGVPAMLADLRGRGYYLAIATGKSRSGLDHVLENLGLNTMFHTTRCADETSSKPNPQMLFEILADLDIGADEALMIGDTEFDMHMAHAAKLDAVAVPHGAHEMEQLQKAEPLTILNKITDLSVWLD